MAGYILHEGALVNCKHPPGTATPDQTDNRVTVSGMKVVTVARTYTVTGCGLSSTNSPPCTIGIWTKGAQRVFASTLAVAVNSGQSICLVSGSPLDPIQFQQRVKAS